MPTRQAFVIEMVGREDIGNAVALNSAIFNAARIVGPAVAGLTIGVFDISTAFFINGLSFMAVIASLLAMRTDELASRRPDGDAQDGPRGVRHARRGTRLRPANPRRPARRVGRRVSSRWSG